MSWVPLHCERPWWECGHWCRIAFDADGDPRQWCGHYHQDAGSAAECELRPEDHTWDTRAVILDFPVDEHLPCVHGLHPWQCTRCQELRKLLAPCGPHGEDPVTCARCRHHQYWNLKGDYDTEAAVLDEAAAEKLAGDHRESEQADRQLEGAVDHDQRSVAVVEPPTSGSGRGDPAPEGASEEADDGLAEAGGDSTW